MTNAETPAPLKPGPEPTGEFWLAIGRNSFYAESSVWFERRFPSCAKWLRRRAQNWTWGLLVSLMALALAGFMSFQPQTPNHYDWDNYEAKAAEPLRSMAANFPPEKHAAKLDFRLTVPLLAHVLGLQRWGHRALYIFFTVGTLWLCYSSFLKWSGDKPAATLFTFALAAIPPGSEVLFGRYFYDPVAFFLGVACLRVTPGWTLAILLFLLSFVDERALLMFPALWLHHSMWREEAKFSTRGTAFRMAGICVVLVLAAHGLTRLWLTWQYGLSLPISGANVGLKCLNLNYRFFELMCLATLEGFWLLLLPLLWRLWTGGRRITCAAYVSCLATPLLSSLIVLDVGRSMNFVLPAFVSLISLLPLFYSIPALRSMLLAVAALNLAFCNIDYLGQPRPGPPALFESSWYFIKHYLMQ